MEQAFSLTHIKERVKEKERQAFLKSNGTIFPKSALSDIKTINNDFGETLTKVDGEIPIDLETKKGQKFLFISHEQTYGSHGLHKYPAKFFPELPRWLINRYSKPHDWILDPFTGSGTANIEALLNKRNSVGIDVEPFARYLSKVKTTPLDSKLLDKLSTELLNKIVKYTPEQVNKEDLPVFPYRDNWFQESMLYELTFIKKQIDKLACPVEIKDFFYVCFSSIIRFVSNADNNCTRTVVRKNLNKNISPTIALKKFSENLLHYKEKMKVFSSMVPKGIRVDFPADMDAKQTHYADNTFDFSLTSPPYVNAVDYPRTHQLELYWLGLVSGSLTPLKKQHIGTESVSAKAYRQLHLSGIEIADKKMESIFEKDPRRAYIAYKYLMEMKANLEETYRILKRGGRYALVVGNNKIKGEIFENWRYLMEMAENVGFSVEDYFGSEIINHFIKVPREERINTDWVLILRKT